MIEILKTDSSNIEELMSIRLEMLRIVNNMKTSEKFSEALVNCSREYFLRGNQTSILAKDGDKVIACASISYITVMPTFSHPTGKRAHLMNVYTNKAYRRQGIAKRMIIEFINEAKDKGCTEISLDATEEGIPLYKTLGFEPNKEGLILSL